MKKVKKCGNKYSLFIADVSNAGSRSGICISNTDPDPGEPIHPMEPCGSESATLEQSRFESTTMQQSQESSMMSMLQSLTFRHWNFPLFRIRIRMDLF